MNTGLLINVLSAIFLLSEVSLLVFKRAKSGTTTIKQDKQSIRILWGVILLSMFLGGYLGRIYPMQEYYSWLVWTGTGIFLFGLLFRMASIYQLGKAFTVDVAVSSTQKVKDNGLYKKLRHPSYTGGLLEFLGLSLLFGSWVSILLINIPIIIAFIYRMNIEEELLSSFFGNEYGEYMKRTKRIIPFIY